MTALYRPHAGEDWQEVDLIAAHPDGFVVREVGRVFPGVMLATDAQVRMVANGYPLSADEWRLYGEGA